MHTMNTMHAMTGSYGMHAMLEENGNPERCFAGAVAGRLWPDRNPCLVPIICLTLHGSNLLPLSRKRDCRSRAGKSAGWRIYRRLPIARCVSVCRKIRPPKPPPFLRRPQWVRLRSRQTSKSKMRWQRRSKDGPAVPIHAGITTISSSTRHRTNGFWTCWSGRDVRTTNPDSSSPGFSGESSGS